MNDVLYQRTIKPAALSADGETPTIVYATREMNCCLVLVESHEQGIQLLSFFQRHERDRAIEWAVEFARENTVRPGTASGGRR